MRKCLILGFLGLSGPFPMHYGGTRCPKKYRNGARAFITGVFAAAQGAC